MESQNQRRQSKISKSMLEKLQVLVVEATKTNVKFLILWISKIK